MNQLNLGQHISQKFNEELEDVRRKVLHMGGIVEEQLVNALQALLQGDTELAGKVVANDQRINALEVEIDEECTLIVARRQPAATDLRLVDVVPDNMLVDPGSISGGGGWSAPEVSWERDLLSYEPWAESFQLAPQEGGTWPTNVEAYVDLVDGWGQAHRIPFPLPEIEVVAPTAVPSACLLYTSDAADERVRV